MAPEVPTENSWQFFIFPFWTPRDLNSRGYKENPSELQPNLQLDISMAWYRGVRVHVRLFFFISVYSTQEHVMYQDVIVPQVAERPPAFVPKQERVKHWGEEKWLRIRS